MSSLSDTVRSWSLTTDSAWIIPSLTNGIVNADQVTQVPLNLESQFDFGLTKGNLTVSDLSLPGVEFDIPITILTRLEQLDLQEKILASPVSLDEMGFAIDIEGDLAVISAPGETTGAAFGGSVHVFRRQADNQWVLESTLSATNGNPGDRFGSDVAIFGNRIIVGAPNVNSVAEFAGTAHVFKYESGQWIEEQQLVPIDGLQNDAFGTAVAMDQDLIIIGAPQVAISFVPGAEQRRGSVYIFRFDGTQWIQESKLQQSDIAQYTRFGGSVAVSGSRVAIGARYFPTELTTTSGRAYTYIYESGAWVLENRFQPPDNDVRTFGIKVALNEDELLIGAPDTGNQETGTAEVNAGAIFSYEFDGNDWLVQQRISGPDIGSKDINFGLNFDFDNSYLLVGVPSDDGLAINSGSVYVYKKMDSQWQADGRLLPENAVSFSQLNYGRDVAVSAGVAVIGSGLKTAASIPTTGYLYELSTPVPHLETITVNNVGSDWVSVSTQNEYQSMVAVCTVHYINNISPVVVRMQNIAIQSFEIKLQNPGDLDQVFADTVYCMIAEEGVWQLADGRKFEAKKAQSTSTARKGGWRYQVRQDYSQDYAAPVVFGQVMSFNDDNWSVFWNRGAKRTLPADSTTLRTGKQVGEDTVTTRNDESIGYMVFDSGTSTIDSIELEIMLSADIIRHIGHSNNAIPVGIASLPEFAILTQSGMDGGDGSWSILEGFEALSFGQLRIAVDEDQIGDSERRHTTENVAYFTATSHLNTELIPIQ